jgi:hypothetical protein
MSDVAAPERARTRTLDQVLDDRIKDLTEWLSENYPECDGQQAHLDEGTPERAYWHFGYLTALCDLRDFLSGRRDRLN